MNDPLVNTLHGFSERVLNPLFAALKRHSANNRAHQLVRLILSKREWEKNELSMTLFGEPNAHGYYRCRSKIKDTIEQVLFELEQSQPTDAAERSFSIARQLLKEHLWKDALDYLTEAEKLAASDRNYMLVKQVHAMMLNYGGPLHINHADLSRRMDENNHLDLVTSKLQLVRGEMKALVKDESRKGITGDRSERIEKVIQSMKITRKMLRDPWLAFNLGDFYRSAIKSQRDYSQFEVYIKGLYNDLSEHTCFQSNTWEHEFGILYFISHACMRNIKIDEIETWRQQAAAVASPEELKTHQFYFKFIALSAAYLSLTGNVETAINTLKAQLEDTTVRLPESDRADFLVNLAVYYFQAGEFSQANTCIRLQDQSRKWLLDHKGLEWLFKKEMIEVLIQYELGNRDIARAWAVGMKNTYAGFFDHELYQFAEEFLSMVIDMIDQPTIINSEEFAARIRSLSDNWPADRRDIQAISFLCWIKSKSRRRPYYEVFREWMEREKEKVGNNISQMITVKFQG